MKKQKRDLMRDFGHAELALEERYNGCIAEYMGGKVTDMKRFGKPGEWGVMWDEPLPGHARTHMLRELEFTTNWEWLILVLKKCRENYFFRLGDRPPMNMERKMKKAYIKMCDTACRWEISRVIPDMIIFMEYERDIFDYFPF